MPLPDAASRKDLMQKTMADAELAVSAQEWSTLADRTASYSGRDLVAVCRCAQRVYTKRTASYGGRALVAVCRCTPLRVRRPHCQLRRPWPGVDV